MSINDKKQKIKEQKPRIWAVTFRKGVKTGLND